MLYIIVGGKKEYLAREVTERYKLKPGMRTPFNGYKIFEDGKKELILEQGEEEVT